MNFLFLPVLNGKLSGSVTAAAKGRCWQQLAVDVSAVSGVMRSAKEVKKKWTCVKSEAKNTVALVNRSLSQTGGRELSEEVTASQHSVIDVIGQVCVEGIAGGVDCAAVKIDYSSGIYVSEVKWDFVHHEV